MRHLQKSAAGHLLLTPDGHLLKDCTCLCLCCTTPVPDTFLVTFNGLEGTLGLANGTWELSWVSCCEWRSEYVPLICPYPYNPNLLGQVRCWKPNGFARWRVYVVVTDQIDPRCAAWWELWPAGACDPRGTYALLACDDTACVCGDSCPPSATCVVSYS